MLTYGENRHVVLIFESGASANYYASLLEAYGFPKPTAELMDDREIKKFCLNSGYEFQFISVDHVAVPPRNHIKSSSWKEFQNTSLRELSTSSFDSKEKEYYLISLRKTYLLYKRTIVDLQQQLAINGFSVVVNRQIEYYTEEIEKITVEIQRWA